MSAFLVLVLAGLSHAARAALPVPVMVEPAPNATLYTQHPHFSWTSVCPLLPSVDVEDTVCAEYRVQIATDSTFHTIVVDDTVGAAVARFFPAQPLPRGCLAWRVRTETASLTQASAWSGVQHVCVAEPQRTFNVSQGSTMSAVQATVAAAAAAATGPGGEPVQVLFWPQSTGAVWRLDPAGQTVFLQLANVRDVVLDGQGINITFLGYLTFVQLTNCSGVQVRNFVFDFDPLPYTAVRVLQVQAAGARARVGLEPGHPPLQSSSFFRDQTIGELMDAATRRVKRGGPLIIPVENFTVAVDKPDQYDFQFPSKLDYLAEGDVIVLDPRIYPGYLITDSPGTVLFNITMYACSNECMTSVRSDKHAILQCQLKLQPGRFLAANNGGHNHHSTRIAPWIEGSLFENTGDDNCHVSGLVMSVLQAASSTSMLIHSYDPMDFSTFGVGDVLLFWDFRDGYELGSAQILKMGPVQPAAAAPSQVRPRQRYARVPFVPPALQSGLAAGGYAVAVELETVLPLQGALHPGVIHIGGDLNQTVTQVFVANRTANQFVFRRNRVHNSRRVGVLAKGERALIEDNVFWGLGGGGVELWNAPFEGLCAASYLVRNNLINDTNQLDRVAGPLYVESFAAPAGSAPPARTHCHRAIHLYNNTIHVGPGSSFVLSNAQQLVFRRNTVWRCGTDPQPLITQHNVAALVFAADNVVLNKTEPWLCVK
eukprot:m.230034 g.230034  ORF g.230034 m.230034 type:complete len:711 (-) comp22404_c0_seq2:36-2168(-)